MKKIIIFILCIILTGCYNKEKIHLSDKFYNEGKYIEIKSNQINNYKNDNYVIFTYNSYCNLEVPCEKIFEKVMQKYKIDFLSIKIDEFKKTYLYKKVKYAPSVIIVKKQKIIAYLDAEKDEDMDKYQDENKFEKWLQKYINFSSTYP